MNNFIIKRVQIEGGFLDGLELTLSEGLNAIIGARGTGKSSFIELIRYCLNVQGHTSESNTKALSHAKAVLKDGQVTVTLSDGKEDYFFTRNSESDFQMNLPKNMKAPMIFSQTEVETIGLLSSGRLKLIDNFIENIDEYSKKELTLIAKINTISEQLSLLTDKANDFETKIHPLKDLTKKLSQLEIEEKKISEISEISSNKSNELKELGEKYSKQNLKIKYLENFINNENIWLNDLKTNIQRIPTVPTWSNEKDENPVNDLIVKRNEFSKDITSLLNKYEMQYSDTLKIINEYKQELEIISKKGQELRSEVDKLQEGAGEITRNCQNVRNEITNLEYIGVLLNETNLNILELQKERNSLINNLEDVRSERSNLRLKICDYLSNELAPKIKVSIKISHQLDEYKQVLTNSFKGSGIQYNDIVNIIAEEILPRELVNIIEGNNINELVEYTGISKDRAIRIISALKTHTGDIITVLLEDEILFKLSDGQKWKNLKELSTGQRCTLILPIILEHKDTILVIDQPEDHIDNAFIVDTLISSILKRKNEGQVIVTTHNANIPVLGKAEIVAQLASNGNRGFINVEGRLNKHNVVNAISNIMEGGEEAFKNRADFYGI
ncbi:MAG: AAA family ATPase [Campylobacteraceae bacterium]|nr:AAA family ATPase [Campylobacteraceae bacterium]